MKMKFVERKTNEKEKRNKMKRKQISPIISIHFPLLSINTLQKIANKQKKQNI